MQAADHDRAVARGSHAVHLLAALAAGLLDGDEQAQALASTGYADTTRVAAGNPALWTDIVRQNRTHVAEALDVAATRLATLRAALADGDDEAVRRLLTEAQRRRADWQARQQRG
jgi:prephenate dehydrogenase